MDIRKFFGGGGAAAAANKDKAKDAATTTTTTASSSSTSTSTPSKRPAASSSADANATAAAAKKEPSPKRLNVVESSSSESEAEAEADEDMELEMDMDVIVGKKKVTSSASPAKPAPTTTTTTTTKPTPSSGTKATTTTTSKRARAATTTATTTKDDDDASSVSSTSSSSSSRDETLVDDAQVTRTSKSQATQTQIDALPKPFDPRKDNPWAAGAPVPYAALVGVMEAVSATKKRLVIQEEVSRFFRRVVAHTPQDLLPCVYLFLNKVCPAFVGLEMGVGDSILIKAICDLTGKSKAAIQASYETEGDLGQVAVEAKAQQKTLAFAVKPTPLSVSFVFEQFKALTQTSGHKSQDAKINIIKKLLTKCQGVEAKYIVRGIQGKLRIGLAEQTVLTALAHAVALTPPAKQPDVGDLRTTLKDDNQTALTLDRAVLTVKRVFSECPSYDEMIPALLRAPVESLPEACHIREGVPLKPMLAKPTNGVEAILARFEGNKFTCEYKYDGERAQIHRLGDGSFKIFSRNSEDNTSKYPDVIAALPDALADAASTTTFIVDAEVVAFDRTTNKTLPFQRLSTRARKDVEADDVKVQVVLYLFDALLINGKSLLQSPLVERRTQLRATFREVPQRVFFASGRDLTETEDIMEFFQDAVKDNCEGLMIKTLETNATYEPSRRSLNWLKLKKDYLTGEGGLADSFDLVPVGAFHGKGKRTGVYGAFLLACYDPDSEVFQSVCKIGTGFSEEMLTTLTERLGKTVAAGGKPKHVLTDIECDVWFEPSAVWEVRAADLSVSPVHKAAIGLVQPDKGIALRFPRFLRERDDKGVDDATSAEQVATFYREQAVVAGGGANRGDDDEEDDG